MVVGEVMEMDETSKRDRVRDVLVELLGSYSVEMGCAGGAEDSAVYYEWASDYAGVIFDALDISSDEQNKP